MINAGCAIEEDDLAFSYSFTKNLSNAIHVGIPCAAQLAADEENWAITML